MKTYQYTLGGQKLTLTLSGEQAAVADILVNGQPLQPAADEMPAYAAAIALALIEHEVEIVHDNEPGVITVEHHLTSWNDPTQQMNQF